MSAVDYKAMDGSDLIRECGTDAAKWAEAFMQHHEHRKDEIDWALMVGWFANAIEQTKHVIRSKEMLASEALFGFAGWLTSRDEAITMGATHHAGPAADAVKEFCDANELESPRPGWTAWLTHPEPKP